MQLICSNRKATHEYHLLERHEAGIELVGTEVKSLRARAASLTDAYATVENGELFMVGGHIAVYEQGNRFNHDPRRRRRLLMHKREIMRLQGKVIEKGLTLIPTRLYFNDAGRVKVEIALARGKRTFDKRASIAKRDSDREVERAMRDHYRG